ncbi:C-8 sterol isomerase [Pestalotiopsis sp. 9143b]|nr:C-8 sterol isomerase [Pestalotiopsis sp. 9143b]
MSSFKFTSKLSEKTKSLNMAKPLSYFAILVGIVSAILVGILSTIVYLLDRNLESFYIFKTDHLHDLARRGIAAHGNETRAIVDYIVTELQEMYPENINLDQEWFFNNHGGAMGSMFIIHASR